MSTPSLPPDSTPLAAPVKAAFPSRWRWPIRLLSLLVVGSLVLALGGWQVWRQAIQPIGGSDPVSVVIAPGTASRQIGRQLRDAGVIRSYWAWNLWTRTLARDWVFQAGTYDIDPQADMVAIAQQLREGQSRQIKITIPEGWRIEQMASYLAAANDIPASEFQGATRTIPRAHFPWLPPSLSNLEGYLFPETYVFAADLFAESVSDANKANTLIQAMLQQFAQIAYPRYQAKQASSNPSPLSLHEWVTLASIVEKEAVIAEERPLIAGVFSNRLRQGIPLGADPTVEYALGIRQTPDRRLTYAEVQKPSPYNTYLNAGLPPGPIASPGLASLLATLDPATTDYLYFVARYDGSHVFSKTLAQHEAAQRQILQNRQQNRQPSPPP
ncbi:MAG: endolytic transglycosylase MltG [Cyanobacteriota bacterium]|nr:endolytic transglycosylase MltG [Cyanobacteriota bacterium]